MVGAQPAVEIVAKENDVTILDHYKGKLKEIVVEDPMTIPREISESWKPQLISELPDTFCGMTLTLLEPVISFFLSSWTR